MYIDTVDHFINYRKYERPFSLTVLAPPVESLYYPLIVLVPFEAREISASMIQSGRVLTR